MDAPSKTENGARCPQCGASTVQGQLVPQKNLPAGLAVGFLSEDAAAGMIALQSGALKVFAFCLSCGAAWLPEQERWLRVLRGEAGAEERLRLRRELEQMVNRGSGFRVVSEEEKRKATWAREILSTADRQKKSAEPK